MSLFWSFAVFFAYIRMSCTCTDQTFAGPFSTLWSRRTSGPGRSSDTRLLRPSSQPTPWKTSVAALVCSLSHIDLQCFNESSMLTVVYSCFCPFVCVSSSNHSFEFVCLFICLFDVCSFLCLWFICCLIGSSAFRTFVWLTVHSFLSSLVVRPLFSLI